MWERLAPVGAESPAVERLGAAARTITGAGRFPASAGEKKRPALPSRKITPNGGKDGGLHVAQPKFRLMHEAFRARMLLRASGHPLAGV